MTATLPTPVASPGKAAATMSLRPPITLRRAALWLVAAGFAVAVVWGWRYIEMTFAGLFSSFGDLANLWSRMWPPQFTDMGKVIDAAIETLWMALIGTFLAVVLSVPIAFLAAANTTPHPIVKAFARAIIGLARAIPDIIFALVFVRAVGIGVLPGILAIALHSIGMVGKLYADAIEQIDDGQVEAVRATGGRGLQVLSGAVIPQVMPSFIGVALYRLDINLRSSTILGVVGAGGIGFLMQDALRGLNYDKGLAIIIVIFVMIVAVEFLSSAIRGRLLANESTVLGAGSRKTLGDRLRARRSARLAQAAAYDGLTSAAVAPRTAAEMPVSPPWTADRRAKVGYSLLITGALAYAFWSVELGPGELLGAFGDVWATILKLFPPDFSTAGEGIRQGMVETIAIGFVATAMGMVVAIPLGVLAARNVAPARWVYALTRYALVALRGMPELILAIVFIIAIGLGPVAGTLALAIGSIGFMAKLIADAVEEVESGPREAVVATGATRLQETFSSVLPQAMPAVVGNTLYMLDINIRSSTILGIVGGGGIGFLLSNSVRTLNWETTGAILLTIFVVVYALELLAGWVRRQVL
jgi:phosphonate transport system permease protein